MANIVLGMALSHTPQLHTPAEQWALRLEADRRNKSHHFRGEVMDWEQLVERRAPEQLSQYLDVTEKDRRLRQGNAAVARLAEIYRDVKPDVAVIIGNDQHELFLEDVMPAMTIYWGDSIANQPARADQAARMPAGIHLAEAGHAPPVALTHPCHPALGLHLIQHSIRDGFDVAQSKWLREADQKISFSTGAPHAYGFVYRNIMGDEVIPHVPVILNTFYPPNQPTARRCFEFGQSLGRALKAWQSDARVAVFGSGGLSHFVIDEDFDKQFLKAVVNDDFDALCQIDENRFQAGTSECKNWITTVGVLSGCGLKAELVDYVACYRSEGGTGTGAGFVSWR